MDSCLLCKFSQTTEKVSTFTEMILSFRTDMPGQTVQTQIRLLLEEQRSSLIRVYTVCHSACIVWTHYSMVEPHSSNFRVITTNFLGVRIFRKFTVNRIPEKTHLDMFPIHTPVLQGCPGGNSAPGCTCRLLGCPDSGPRGSSTHRYRILWGEGGRGLHSRNLNGVK